MSGRSGLRARAAPILLAFGWMALLWLGVEIARDLLGQGRPQANPSALAEALLAAEAPATSRQADAAAAEKAAREALLASPLDSAALALLGLAAEARDDTERALKLMELAAARAPADLLAQAWLFRHRLAAGDVGGALFHADAILRAEPDALDRLVPALAAIAGDPARMPALAAHLAAGPPWRSRFLERLAGAAPEPLAPFGLFSALMASDGPPKRPELRPYLLRLVQARLYEQARLLWTETLGEARLAEIGYLFNGGFEAEPTGIIFDWALEPVAGARTEIANAPGGDGRALRVAFLDRRVAFRHVRQLLMLMPGRYRLTGRVKAEALANERGLHWTLTCAEEPAARLGASERIKGTTPWQAFATEFDVPAAGCKAQWLRLELAARIPSERHATGAAWYDGLALARIEQSDDCLDEGPARQALPDILADLQPPDPTPVSAGAPEAEESGPACTCAAPVGTSAELTEIEGDVVVFRGERSFAPGAEVELLAGDRVVVWAGGRGVLVQGACRFELTPQSVLTVSADQCRLCAAVMTSREANVAYGQSAGGGAAATSVGGGGAVGTGVGSAGLAAPVTTGLAPVTAAPSSPLLLNFGSGETRPPASQ